MTRRALAAGGRLAIASAIVGLAVMSSSGAVAAATPGLTPASVTSPVMRAGSANGPFPVHGGSNPAQIAHLPIGSGNWTVFAKGLAINTTADELVPRPVSCVLAIGSNADQVLASPLGAGDDSSREAFLLTLSVHLSHPGSASLRCAAPGSATGNIAVRWVRMVAFKTAGLSLASVGGPYQQFGNTVGESQVYQVHSSTVVGLTMGTEGAVASMSLPAGAWAITAKATIRETSAESASFSCSLNASGDLDRVVGAVDPAGEIADRLPIALQVIHDFASTGSVVLNCASSNPGGTTKIRDVRITAYRTSGLNNQNLLVDNHFAAFGSGVEPVVDAGFADGPIALTGNSSFHQVAAMSLPKGKWVVVAKAYLDDSSSPGFRTVRCHLGDGTKDDTTELQLPGQTTIDTIQPMDLMWSGSLASRTNVTLSCRTAGAHVNVDWVKMTAYQAGTLQTVSIH